MLAGLNYLPLHTALITDPTNAACCERPGGRCRRTEENGLPAKGKIIILVTFVLVLRRVQLDTSRRWPGCVSVPSSSAVWMSYHLQAYEGKYSTGRSAGTGHWRGARYWPVEGGEARFGCAKASNQRTCLPSHNFQGRQQARLCQW